MADSSGGKAGAGGPDANRDLGDRVEKAKTEKEAHGEFESEIRVTAAPRIRSMSATKGVRRVYQQTVIDTYANVTESNIA